ncbi:CesT family type III secretion system chaperone [Pokkaliibacter sp. CJK22405]|uniref:CesT family type III secretion system chaperone n=1 Tax=Pokkaliibacter sp. CJK22405 TaxID=3384615 RepID=UPI0039849955
MSSLSSPVAKVNQLLKELAERCGLPELALDENQVCGIQAPGTEEDIVLTLFMPEPKTHLMVLAEVIELSRDNPGDLQVLYSLLQMSFPGITNRGCVFSIDERSNQLVLSYQESLEALSSELLESLIANLLQLVRYFRHKARELQKSQQRNAAPASRPELNPLSGRLGRNPF